MAVTDVRRSGRALELFLTLPHFFLLKQQEVNDSATNLLKYFLHTPVRIILFSSFNSVSVIIFTAVSCRLLSPCVCSSVPADAASLYQSGGATIRQFFCLNVREMKRGKYELRVKGKGKGKGTVHHRTGHQGPKEKKRYKSTLSLISVLDGGGWPTPRSGRFTPGKESHYSLYRRLGGP